MKLSIAMMVKDEEKNLERSLKSLEHLRKSIDSELIIVDTGSKDKTVEIAKKYTDKIYFHKWNNNFSDMRNITINYSKGEWIFIIDADECLENDEEIIKILKLDIDKRIGAFSIKVNNITSSYDQSENVMNVSPRFFRNDDNFRYEGAVHNRAIYKGMMFKVNSILTHYGYIIDDKSLMEYKFERTSTILKEELKKDSKNIYYTYQLAISYQMHGDISEAFKIIERAYDMLKNDKDKINYFYVYSTYTQLLVLLKSYDKGIKIGLEGIRLCDEYIDLYYYLGAAYLEKNEYKNCIKMYMRYLDILKNWNKVKIKDNTSLKFNTLNNSEDVYFNLFILKYKSEKYEEIEKYILKLTKRKLIERAIPIIIKICKEKNDFTILKKFIDEKIKLVQVYELAIFVILEENIKELNSEELKLFLESFCQCKNLYGMMCNIKLKDMLGQECKKDIIDWIDIVTISKNNFKYPYFNNILYFSFKHDINMFDYFINQHEEYIDDILKSILDNYKDFGNIIANKLDVFENIKDDYEKTRIKKIMLLFTILIGKLSKEKYRATFKEYIKVGTQYLKNKYKSTVFENERLHEISSVEEKFLFYVDKAIDAKNLNSKQYVLYLKKALEIYPYMKIGIELLTKEVENKINSQHNELENYKKQVKQTISALIANNNLEEAQVLINEYKSIDNSDIEISSIEVVLNGHLNKKGAEKFTNVLNNQLNL